MCVRTTVSNQPCNRVLCQTSSTAMNRVSKTVALIKHLCHAIFLRKKIGALLTIRFALLVAVYLVENRSILQYCIGMLPIDDCLQ